MMQSKRLVNLLVDSLFLAGLSILLHVPSARADRLNMMGEWSGSPDCPITFYKDDGKYIEGACDNGSFNHIFRGSYSNPNQISLTVTRIDPNHCQTTVPASITMIDNNHVRYLQGGWDGCGVRTNPVKQDWQRVGNYSSGSGGSGGSVPSPMPSPSPSPMPSPSPSPSQKPSQPEQKPCLVKFAELCIF